jgi:hypothetical protein
LGTISSTFWIHSCNVKIKTLPILIFCCHSWSKSCCPDSTQWHLIYLWPKEWGVPIGSRVWIPAEIWTRPFQ